MGGGTFDSHAYRNTSSSYHGKTREQIFTSSKMKKEFDPKHIKMRESRDSPDKDASNAVIVALDQTGSMGILAEVIARKGLGELAQSLLDKKPVTDPHFMFMAIGDASNSNTEEAPLQVSQFEADNRTLEQLVDLYLEGKGGGNDSESYHLPWYFAAVHTSIDCWEKRQRKGYLFTVGDECVPGPLTAEQINLYIGDTPEKDYTAEELLKMAQRTYHCFHIIIEEGNYASSHLSKVQRSWGNLMGQNVLSLKDHTKLAEGIVAVIQMNEAAMGHGKTTKNIELPGGATMLLK